MRPLLIAHRGDTVNFPENTLEAFRSAFEKGADGIELDTQLEDGKCIVVHDFLHESKKNYPLLSEILDAFPGKKVEVEVKSFSMDIIKPLKKVLTQHANVNIEITTSVHPLVRFLREEFPNHHIGVIFPKTTFEPWMPPEFITRYVSEMMTLMRADVAHIPNDVLSAELVELCHAQNWLIHTHIPRIDLIEQEKRLRDFQKMGVDQCTFDDIRLLE